MPWYDDDCLSIEVPEGWRFEREYWCYQVVLGRSRSIVFQLFPADFGFTAPDQYELWRQQSKATVAQADPRLAPTTLTDPLVCGPLSGFSLDFAPYDRSPHAHSRMHFLLDNANLTVNANGLKPAEHEQLLAALATLEFKDDYLRANERLAKRWEVADKKANTLDATDLSKPRQKTLTTWMHHQMVLLMDGEWFPEDDPFGSEDEFGLVTPCNDQALWVMSQTEFDVTLEFVVRSKPPRPRKVWWNREGEATLSISTGELHVEQTTVGLLLAIALEPGDYRVIARGSCPEGADGGDEGVEKIQIVIVPAE